MGTRKRNLVNVAKRVLGVEGSFAGCVVTKTCKGKHDACSLLVVFPT
jgi:hypothetical protein